MARRGLHLVHPVHLEVVALPVEVAHLLHPLDAKQGEGEDFRHGSTRYLGALEGSREPECLLPCLQMLRPQGHSEHVDLVNK